MKLSMGETLALMGGEVALLEHSEPEWGGELDPLAMVCPIGLELATLQLMLVLPLVPPLLALGLLPSPSPRPRFWLGPPPRLLEVLWVLLQARLDDGVDEKELAPLATERGPLSERSAARPASPPAPTDTASAGEIGDEATDAAEGELKLATSAPSPPAPHASAAPPFGCVSPLMEMERRFAGL